MGLVTAIRGGKPEEAATRRRAKAFALAPDGTI